MQGLKTKKSSGRRSLAAKHEALYEVGSGFNWDVSASFLQSLHDEVPGAVDDAMLSASELRRDTDGTVLLEALQSQVSAELGVDASLVNIHGIATRAVKGTTRLQATTLYDVSTLAPALEEQEADGSARTVEVGGSAAEAESEDAVYTRPSREELSQMSEAQLRAVKDFAIVKPGYGEVVFGVAGHRYSDVRGIDLERVLRWSGQAGEITNIALFAKDGSDKPAPGVGLNKPASVEVYFNKDWDEFRVAKRLSTMGAKLLSLSHEAKALKFEVAHF